MKNMNMNTNANNTTSLTNTSHLSSLEYAGLESLFQRIIDTYEAEYLGIEPCSATLPYLRLQKEPAMEF